MILKRKLSYLTIGSYFFLSGVEYAVILPTMWLYIHSTFGASTAFFGLMLAAFSISDLFCSPVYGRIYDKYRRTKYLILFSNLWEIGGNIMYFMGISLPFLLISRFVTGIGAGAGAAIVSDITHTTTQSERTGAIAILMVCRQVGLVIGPGCNIFLRLIDTHIGQFPLNAYTVPGLFMASLWILHSILCLFLHTDFVVLQREDAEQQQQQQQQQQQIQDERSPLLQDHHYQQQQQQQQQQQEQQQQHGEVELSMEYCANEYLRHEVVAILATVFVTLFNQTALEAMLTPLTKEFLEWGELENSMLYLGAGVEVIIVFIGVRFASRKFKDSTLVLFGSFTSIVAVLGLMIYLPIAKPGDPKNLPFLIGGVVVDVIALPFLVTCSVSLYSKITNPATQGLSQGLRRSVIGLATILGPLWAGSLFSQLAFMLAVLLGLILLVTMMLALSTPKLRTYELEPIVDAAIGNEDNNEHEGSTSVYA